MTYDSGSVPDQSIFSPRQTPTPFTLHPSETSPVYQVSGFWFRFLVSSSIQVRPHQSNMGHFSGYGALVHIARLLRFQV